MALVMDKEALDIFMAREFPQVEGDYALELLEDGAVRLRLRVSDKHLRPGGTISGPAMFALADMAMYYVLLAMIGPRRLIVTTNTAIDFLRRPAAGKDLLCEARVLKLGRTLAVGDALIFSEGQAGAVARAGLTYSVPPPGVD